MNTIGSRLKYAIEEDPSSEGLSYSYFSEKTGIQYRTLQNYLSDKRSPNVDTLEKLSNYGININWLITGKGDVYKSSILPSDIVYSLIVMCYDKVHDRCLSETSEIFSYPEKMLIFRFMSELHPSITKERFVKLYKSSRTRFRSATSNEIFEVFREVVDKIHPDEGFDLDYDNGYFERKSDTEID